ncbi:MAG: transglutaminase-like cysteine peptidase [Hyphomonadaceae bacterium]
MRTLAICLLLAACASPVGNERLSAASRLTPGAEVAPPDGLLDYCARRPQDCGAATTSDLRGLLPATGAATWQNASSRRRDDTVFAAMMAARLSRGHQQPAVASSSVVTLTEERWRELRRVNREINRAIRPTTDRALYGVEEYWQRPLLVGAAGARGDCEDYVLEKRARLLALGYAPDSIAMAVAIAPGVGLHAVLIVQTDRGDVVLDNLYGEPRRLVSLDYVWISRQVGPTLSNWAAARAEGVSQAAHLYADASAEARFARLMQERLNSSTTPTPAPTIAALSSNPANAPGTPTQPAKLGAPCLAAFGGCSSARSNIQHVAP